METLKLDKDEHIDFVSCSFSSQGVHTLTLKTTKSQLLMAEGETKLEGIKTVDINLADFGKAVVGFRTGFNENLEMMAVYTLTRIDAPPQNKSVMDNDFDYLFFEGIFLGSFFGVFLGVFPVAFILSIPEYWSKSTSSS
jgi:hypothetical protein